MADSCAGIAIISPTRASTNNRGSGRPGRANKLRQRLGITGIWEDMAAAPEKPEGMSALAYAQLLEAMLQAELQAAEAGTARLLQLATRIGSRRRRKPQFTL